MYVQLEHEGVDARWLDFLPFKEIEAAVRASVVRLRETPLLPDDYDVRGFIYGVHTGRLEPVDV
jgi:carbonic anhydrase